MKSLLDQTPHFLVENRMLLLSKIIFRSNSWSNSHVISFHSIVFYVSLSDFEWNKFWENIRFIFFCCKYYILRIITFYTFLKSSLSVIGVLIIETCFCKIFVQIMTSLSKKVAIYCIMFPLVAWFSKMFDIVEWC